jgi:hypothetical protein
MDFGAWNMILGSTELYRALDNNFVSLQASNIVLDDNLDDALDKNKSQFVSSGSQ